MARDPLPGVSLRLLSSIAHAVGQPSFERLTTEQRFSALNAALLMQQTDVLRDIVTILDRPRGA